MSKIKVLLKKVGEQAKAIEIDDNLETFQTIVGGYIETVGLGGGFVMVCNEEGAITSLPLNFKIQGSPIFGNVFFTKVDYDSERDFSPLMDGDVELLKTRLEFNDDKHNDLKRAFERLLLDLDFEKYVAKVTLKIGDVRELHIFDTDDFLDLVFQLPVATQKKLFVTLLQCETRSEVVDKIEQVLKMYICGRLELPPLFTKMIDCESEFVG